VKVLIFGAGGQVGRALAVTAPETAQVIGVPHTEVDIADESAVLRCVSHHRPELIINAAAYTAVDRAESEPEQARRVNADAPRFIAAAARDVRARLLHISTDFVFDGLASQPYRPDSVTHPLSVYGATKLAGEQAVLATMPDGSVVVRTAWVYAARGQNFVSTMLRLLAERKTVRVIADQIGTPTAALSLAEILWKLGARADVTGVHHFTDAGVASWYDFATAIAEEAAQMGLLPLDVQVIPISTEEYPTPARRPRFSVLDKKSLTDALGIQLVHWRQRLRTVLGALRNG
jgi:dTDP-4-dehydrorhamnose reductase